MPPRPLSATFDQPRSPPVQRKAAISKEDTDDRAHLTPAEKAWSAHQSYLEENGFVLRPRLRRGWKPSWQGTSDDPSYHEDSIRITKLGIVDATRTSDGAQVVLKAMRGQSVQDGSVGQPDELAILKYLHSPPYVGHACNHATPFLGSIPMPNTTEGNFGILPLLRMHNDPPLLRVGEAVEFMKQILRGLAFMHAQNVVHRDIKPSNIMMAGEALYDEPFHPVAQSLSLDAKSILRPRARHELDFHQPHDGESPVRYYFVNFSRASYLPPVTTDGQSKRMFLRSTRGQMGRFPEAMLTVGHDPFKADVYCMGKYVIDEMITRHLALAPFTPVSRDMTRRDPRTRPTSAEAFAHFETIRGSLEPKYLNIPLDSKAHYIKPPLPIRSPRRAVSTTHLSARALRQPYSHASWSSTDSAHTLVAEIPPLPAKEVLKRPEPVSRAVFEVSVQEAKPVEAKKSKGKWGALCNAVKTMVR